MDETEGVQVEIQERREGGEILLAHPPCPHIGINFLPPPPTTAPYLYETRKRKHIFLHAATFIQGPSPLLVESPRRVDVVPFPPPLNFLGL